jgi:hypothetical protein
LIARIGDWWISASGALPEKVLDDTVEGEKPLGLASRFESAHVPFSLASRLMRNFGAIVGGPFRVGATPHRIVRSVAE